MLRYVIPSSLTEPLGLKQVPFLREARRYMGLYACKPLIEPEQGSVRKLAEVSPKCMM